MSDPIGDKQAYNDLSIRTIFLIGLLSAVGLFVIITGARTLFQKWQASEYQEKQINIPLASVDAELQVQRAAIDRYGWNADTDAAAIPVGEAMRQVVDELQTERGETVADEADAAENETEGTEDDEPADAGTQDDEGGEA